AELFQVVRKLRDAGMGIVFVTHFMDQVYAVSNRITVLRNGKLVGEYTTAELPRLKLISHMIGRELEAIATERTRAAVTHAGQPGRVAQVVTPATGRTRGEVHHCARHQDADG